MYSLGSLIMAQNATLLSVWGVESQAGNPIGSELVHIIYKYDTIYIICIVLDYTLILIRRE